MFVVVPQMVADTVLAPLVTWGIKEMPPNPLIDMSLCLSISYRFDSTKITIILYTNDQIYFFLATIFFFRFALSHRAYLVIRQPV